MTNNQPAALSLASVTKAYGGNNAEPVLQNLTFDVKKGELLSIVGHSGTGKSTLLRCMAGLLPLTDGTIELHGTKVTGPPEGLAVVFQDYSRSLLPWMRVLENVTLPLIKTTPSRTKRRLVGEAALASVGLAGTGQKYPWELSGGMQQRVAIARAIACEPEVLLMDEPFASVDAQTRAELEDLSLKIRAEFGMTMVVVTHDIDEAVYLGDRVIVLAGKPASVKADVEVHLPRVRDQISTKADPEFIRLRSEVFKLIRSRGADTDASEVGLCSPQEVSGNPPANEQAMLLREGS